MALSLVVYELPPAGVEALQAATWELSESHWMIGGGMLVATSVSPAYLFTHLRQAVRRAGADGVLLVTRVTSGLEVDGVDDAVRGWIASNLEVTSAE